MVLLPQGAESGLDGAAPNSFLAFLWDIGLGTGHSVRTIEECQHEALADLGVATDAVRRRGLLAGPPELYAALRRALAPDRLWSVTGFLRRQARPNRPSATTSSTDTAYNLEPNVKQSPEACATSRPSPGWQSAISARIARRACARAASWRRASCLRGSSRPRPGCGACASALHLAERPARGSRCSSTTRSACARMFGYEDATYTPRSRAVHAAPLPHGDAGGAGSTSCCCSRSARRCSRTATRRALPLIRATSRSATIRIEAVADDVFARHPSALLELFVVLQQNPRLSRRARPTRCRAHRARACGSIDEEFRQNPRNHRPVLSKILRAPAGVTHELRRMNLVWRARPLHSCLQRASSSACSTTSSTRYTVDAHTLFRRQQPPTPACALER